MIISGYTHRYFFSMYKYHTVVDNKKKYHICRTIIVIKAENCRSRFVNHHLCNGGVRE